VPHTKPPTAGDRPYHPDSGPTPRLNLWQFESLDTDRNGILSYDEVQAGIKHLRLSGGVQHTPQLTLLARNFDKYKGVTKERFIATIQQFVTS
jgi:hypothetical protein